MDGSGARGVDELAAVRGQWGAQSQDERGHRYGSGGQDVAFE
ncbi:hypothetical protein OG568_46370 [Streptomyces sp. NBC_01450]|nr:hypothetical protein [Streptomyces sp. NBC_01450]